MAAHANEPFAWKVHGYLNDYIRLADAKAAALLAVFGALVGVLASQWASGGHEAEGPATLLFGLALALDALVILAAFFVVAPRIRWPGKGLLFSQTVLPALFLRHPTMQWPSTGLIFWESVAASSPEEYRKDMTHADSEALIKELASHCHELSQVARDKYRALTVSFPLAVLAFALSIASLSTL